MSKQRKSLNNFSNSQIVDSSQKIDIISINQQKMEGNQQDIHLSHKKELHHFRSNSLENRQISNVKQNMIKLNKNVSDYQSNQLLKMQKSILQNGDHHLKTVIDQRFNDNMIGHIKENIIKISDNDRYPINKIQDQSFQPLIQSSNIIQQEYSTSTLKDEKRGSELSKRRSLTEQGENDQQWSGKQRLSTENNYAINFSCQYLKQKKDQINKIEEYQSQIQAQKQLKLTKQPSNEQQQIQLVSKSNNNIQTIGNQQVSNDQIQLNNDQQSNNQPFDNTQSKKKQSVDQNSVQQLNNEKIINNSQISQIVKKLGKTEFQEDFSIQEKIQEQEQKDKQRNIYNQLIQQKLQLNFHKKSEGNKINNQLNNSKVSYQNNVNAKDPLNLNYVKIQVLSFLPSLQQNTQDSGSNSMNQFNDKEKIENSSSEELTKNVLQETQINNDKKILKKNNQLAKINENKQVIQYINNSFKELDKSKGLPQYLEQLKTLNDKIKYQIQQNLKIIQPSTKKIHNKQRYDDNVVQYLNKSESSEYNLSFYKIDTKTDTLQKISKNPNYTLHEKVDQNLLTRNSKGSYSLPRLSKQQYQFPKEIHENKIVINKIQTNEDKLSQTEDNHVQKRRSISNQQYSKVYYSNIYQNKNQINETDEDTHNHTDKQIDVYSESSRQNTESNDYLNNNEEYQYQQNTKSERSHRSLENSKYIQKLLQYKMVNDKDNSKQEMNFQKYSHQQFKTNIPYNANINKDDNKLDYAQNQNLSFNNKYSYKYNLKSLSDKKYDKDQNEDKQLQSILNDNYVNTQIKQSDQQSNNKLKENGKYIKEIQLLNKVQSFNNQQEQSKKLQFANDPDQIIEEEEYHYTFDELMNKKFNGVFNDSLYQEHIIKNIFNKNENINQPNLKQKK